MRILPVVLLLAAAAGARATDPPGTAKSRAALDLCHQADDATAEEAKTRTARGLALAEEAVHDDDGDALAHFAVFCNLGGGMRRAGISLSAVTGLHRLRHEVDRTLALAPDFADALAGKGALLIDSPRLLGGDPAEGERLLRRALAVDPDYIGPRLDLARALLARGARDEARTEAERARAIAERKHAAADAATARALLDEIGR